ncbi:MAG: hypothetical protein IT379_32785 [Deltaproteobacteria bacterium]|nr:hypothetical protein [Deltaproteobacteria bacterium]
MIGCLALAACAVGCGDDDGAPSRDAGIDDAGDAGDAGPCPAPGQRQCRGVCIDTLSDDDNCGVCGARCPSTEACVDGSCRVVACTEAPLAMCGTECVDTRVHPSHCGGCGQACPLGELCAPDPDGAPRGACRCAPGRTRCDDGCVDLLSSDAHCGACGVACTAPESCFGGTCTDVCGALAIECDGACVSPNARDTCGSCDNRCPEGVPCIAGACGGCGERVACATGCRDLTEASDCGQCGFRAPLGAACVDGTAVCAEGHRACGTGTGTTLLCARTSDAMECDACNGGDACADGSYCVAGACTSATVVGLRVDCGGPYLAGSGVVQCHAYLELDGLGEIDVTSSRSLVWIDGGCEGDACPPGGGTDQPLFVGGPGNATSAGYFLPAGATDPSRITAGTLVVVLAEYLRDATALRAETWVVTAPVP